MLPAHMQNPSDATAIGKRLLAMISSGAISGEDLETFHAELAAYLGQLSEDRPPANTEQLLVGYDLFRNHRSLSTFPSFFSHFDGTMLMLAVETSPPQLLAAMLFIWSDDQFARADLRVALALVAGFSKLNDAARTKEAITRAKALGAPDDLLAELTSDRL